MNSDLEVDLTASSVIIAKCKNDVYATTVYSALCNMIWQKKSEWHATAGELAELDEFNNWSCTWRTAGGIVASLRGEGDYLDWYCAGQEGNVTDEIAEDFKQLGWHPLPWDIFDDETK